MMTKNTPMVDSVAPSPPLYSRLMPLRARMMETTVTAVTRSLKNTAIITATITGYTNRMVEAMPASMKLKLKNNVSDDATISVPSVANVFISRSVTANDLRCATIITARISVAKA